MPGARGASASDGVCGAFVPAGAAPRGGEGGVSFLVGRHLTGVEIWVFFA